MADWDIYAGLDANGEDAELQPLASTATAAGWPQVNPVIAQHASKPQTVSAASAVLAFQDAEVKELKARVGILQNMVRDMQDKLVARDNQVKTLEQERVVLVRNLSSIYRTAVAELERRTAEIQGLRVTLQKQAAQAPLQAQNKSQWPPAQSVHKLSAQYAADAAQMQPSSQDASLCVQQQPGRTSAARNAHPTTVPRHSGSASAQRAELKGGSQLENRQDTVQTGHNGSRSRCSTDDMPQFKENRQQSGYSSRTYQDRRPSGSSTSQQTSKPSRVSRQEVSPQCQKHAGNATASTDHSLGQKRRLEARQHTSQYSSSKQESHQPLGDRTNRDALGVSAPKRARY